ncbi:Heat shock cognate 71 kDa protein [Orchesella cincta]|uniref:Heat shock cognate 71 kDa protein n=1 Tax=Orchesella cincta TaxID=48709 RepID=A0A1D2M3Q7_ORCCI|nr:Heat shock cognate 71 kDa protein [Orchesella cincta]
MLTEKLQGDDELRNSLLSKFGNFVSRTYNAVVGNIENKMEKERVTMFKLLQDIRLVYHDEMTKLCKGRDFSTLGALERLHRRSTVNAISQCTRTSKITLSIEQRQRLVAAMEDSFCKYKLEYTVSKSNQTENPAIGIDLGTTYCCVAVIGKDQKLKVIQSHEGDDTTPSYVAFHDDGSHVIGQTAKDEAYRHTENTVFDAKRMIGRRMGDPKLQDDIKFWPFTVIEHEGAATVDAGEMAGFEVLTILNEPTAAAIAYKMEHFSDIPKKVLVYDLGGGTFDVAVLQTGAKVIDVLGVDGDTHLGGEDFDKNLMQECVRVFKQQTGIDLLKDKDSQVKQKKEECRRILRRLQSHSEKAKRQLSSAFQATITVDGIVPNKDLNVVITRTQFEELNKALFQKTMDVVDKALRDAKITKDQVDDILLVGGSTRIPKIRDMLTKHFNNKSLSHSVHPDVAVAYGAAVQAALLNGAKGDTLFDFESIRDVTPMALGVEAIIERVSGRNQRAVEINVYQGEDRVAKHNNFLGTFDLEGIPPNEAGMESLDVKMEIDKMGILHVTAVCNSNRNSNSITVQAKKGRLTETEKKEIRTAIQAQAKKNGGEGQNAAENGSSTSNYEEWFKGTGIEGKSTSGRNFDLSDEEF